VVHVLSEPEAGWQGPTGVIDERCVRTQLPDYAERDFYVSGPAPMVDAVVRTLTSALGIGSGRVFSEHFPGYAAMLGKA
jgi:ferredoxin-NADP reductase